MTDDLEPRLRRHLERVAGRAEPVPDTADLDARISARRRRTTRGLGAALAIALAAGPLGGWALARSTEPDVRSLAAAGDGEAEGDGGSGQLVADQGTAYFDYLGPSLPLVGERTTQEGLRLVVRLGQPYEAYQHDGEDPCLPDGLARVGVTDGALVGGVTTEVHPGSRTFVVIGAAEGTPVWVVIARADGVGTVEARFPNGVVDQAEATGGLAVLAAYAPVGTPPHDMVDDTVEVTGLPGRAAEDGPAVVTSAYMADADPCASPPPFVEPPAPTMPEPGEPPTDEAAARAAITDTFLAAFDGANDRDAKAPHYERSDVWLAASEEWGQIPSNEGVAESLYAEVHEIVFTSADRASVRFSLMSRDTEAPALGNQIGEAVLIDGQWKVSIETSCGLVAMGGVECDL
jgi:hypothetical protein